MMRSSAKCRLPEVSYVSTGDCFAALQLILSRFIGWRRFHRNRPTVFGHAGRVTLPMRRPWRFPAYDRFTVLSVVPFSFQFCDLRLLRNEGVAQYAEHLIVINAVFAIVPFVPRLKIPSGVEVHQFG